MPIRSRVTTPPHIHRYPDGSEWRFRALKNDADEEAIQNLTTATVSKAISPKELRRARRENRVEELVMENISQETRMSVKRATLLQMTDSWEGPEFVIPTDFVKGEELNAPERDPKTGEYLPHPLAGDTAPVAAEWIAVRDPNELDEILEALEEVWSGRTEADQEAFSGGDTRLEQQRSGQRRAAKEVSAPVTAD